jgi:hypothetical protein
LDHHLYLLKSRKILAVQHQAEHQDKKQQQAHLQVAQLVVLVQLVLLVELVELELEPEQQVALPVLQLLVPPQAPRYQQQQLPQLLLPQPQLLL